MRLLLAAATNGTSLLSFPTVKGTGGCFYAF